MKQFFYYNLITQDCSARLQHLFFCKGLLLNSIFLRVSHLEHEKLDWASCIWTVRRKIGAAPGTASSHVSDWNYCTHVGAEVFPPPHFLPELCFSAPFLSIAAHDNKQQNNAINTNRASGFRVWLLRVLKVSCLKGWRRSSSSVLALDGCPDCSFCCCAPAKMLGWLYPSTHSL